MWSSYQSWLLSFVTSDITAFDSFAVTECGETSLEFRGNCREADLC